MQGLNFSKQYWSRNFTISQVIVDDSVWNFSITPSPTLKRFDEGKVVIKYPWVKGDPHTIKLITENGNYN